jgi:hypothetical protein
LGEVKAVLKTLVITVGGLGGFLTVAYGIPWAVEAITGIRVSAGLTLVVIPVLCLIIAMCRLVGLSGTLKDCEAARAQMVADLDLMREHVEQATERAVQAEGRIEELVGRARQLWTADSPENLSLVLRKYESVVESARSYTQTRQRWEQRQIRVLLVGRQLDGSGRSWHIARLNVGTQDGASRGLSVEVSTGSEALAYGSIVSVESGQESLAALVPYDPAAEKWRAVDVDIDLVSQHVPQGWMVNLADTQVLSGIAEAELQILAGKLRDLIECLDRLLAGGGLG